MKKIEMTITDPAGMHARPASVLSKESVKYTSEIHLHYGEKKANMKSIMGILALGIKANNQATISIDGEDEDQAIEGLKGCLDGIGA